MEYYRSALSIGLIAVVLGLGQACGLARVSKVASESQPVSHELWDQLLREYVDEYGLVDYAGLRADSARLRAYLDVLESAHPNDENWSREEQLAYWLNAYNAFTVELILRHYPVASIKDIKNGIPFVNTVWDIEFIHIQEQAYTLNNIEHGIIRKYYDEPRIHFALVCAAMSCPKLQRFAYTPEQLSAQLDSAGTTFLNDRYRNEVRPDVARLSKILDWYWGDFKPTYADRQALVNAYYKGEAVTPATEIDFLEYNWALNEQTPEQVDVIRRAWSANR
jgi:hypothetical protein